MNGTRLLYLLLLILGIGLTLVFVAWPVAVQWPRLNRDMRSLTEQQNTLQNRLNQYQEQQQEYQDLVRLFGPPLTDPTTRMPRLVSQIQSLCGGAQVQVISLQPLPREEAEEGWVRFPVQLTVRGDLNGLVTMLYHLRNQVPLTDAERLTVRSDPKNRKELTIQMLLTSYGLLADEILAERAEKAESPPSAQRGKGRGGKTAPEE